VNRVIFGKLVAVLIIRESMSSDKDQLTPEQAPDFEKAEMDLLRASLRLSYKERFLRVTRLYKIQQTMKRAVITHKPFVSK
jgi:hypothetical protein